MFLGRNQGSPIRIFTNVDQSKITLPVDENYRFCDECNRWVCSENVHCFKCNNCTSKVMINVSLILNILLKLSITKKYLNMKLLIIYL